MAGAKTTDWPIDSQGEVPTFGRYLRCSPTKQQIRDAHEAGIIQVKDDEQRGFDPITGREILNESKMKRWAAYEHNGELFLGQLNYALHTEAGSSFQIVKNTVKITGPILCADGRQRTYTIRHAVDEALLYGIDGYDVDTPVEVTLWLDAPSPLRKEIYAQLNGGRGGDHASKSSVEWMAPEGPLQEAACFLVGKSKHLGMNNVNVKADAVTRQDSRIAGFHTFVKSLEMAWGRRRQPTPDELVDLKAYLVTFYDRLVEARPEMGVLDLGSRQKAREELITSNPLFIYGAMQVAIDLYFAADGKPDLSVLDALAGEQGEEFLSLDNQVWKDNGVMAPVFDRKTHTVTGYRATNSLQTRRAVVQAVVERFAD